MKTSSTRLKAHLGRYLRDVRAGREIVVTDRDLPVAKLVPYRDEGAEPLVIQPRDPQAPALGAVSVRAVRARGVDSTKLLREDRDRR